MTTTDTTAGWQPQAPSYRLHLSVLVILGVIIALEQGWLIARGAPTQRQQWEYVIEGPADDELRPRLQALGASGWELVNARRATSDVGGRTVGIYEMIFRRPLDPNAPVQLLPATPRTPR
jgi:hypothetical protein